MRLIFSSLLFCFALFSQAQYLLPKPQLLIDSGIHKINIYREVLGQFNTYAGDTLRFKDTGVERLVYQVEVDDKGRVIKETTVLNNEVQGYVQYVYDKNDRLIKRDNSTSYSNGSVFQIIDLPNGEYEFKLSSDNKLIEYAHFNSDGIYLKYGYYREVDSLIKTQDPTTKTRKEIWYTKGTIHHIKEFLWTNKDDKPYEYIERRHQFVDDKEYPKGISEESFKIKEDGSLKLHGWFKDNYEYKILNFSTWPEAGPDIMPSTLPLNSDKLLKQSIINSDMITFSGDAEYYIYHFEYLK